MWLAVVNHSTEPFCDASISEVGLVSQRLHVALLVHAMPCARIFILTSIASRPETLLLSAARSALRLHFCQNSRLKTVSMSTVIVLRCVVLCAGSFFKRNHAETGAKPARVVVRSG